MHEQAFGFCIEENKVAAFLEYADAALKDYDFSSAYKVDFIFNANLLEKEDILSIARLGHLWGQGINEPYIAVENIQILKYTVSLLSPDKNPTMKITLPNGISMIKFKSSAEEVEKLQVNDGILLKINVVGRCAINEWNGTITPQLLIDDYEIAERGYDF